MYIIVIKSKNFIPNSALFSNNYSHKASKFILRSLYLWPNFVAVKFRKYRRLTSTVDMLHDFILLWLFPLQSTFATPPSASTFAGATTAFQYPPNATTVPTSYFPDPSQVGFGGPTPSMFRFSYRRHSRIQLFVPAGDAAAAIKTAPAISPVDDIYPLLAPAAANSNAKKFDVLGYLGNLSPMKSVPSFCLPNASPRIPEGCELNQIHLLHRHGARYPTSGNSSGPAAFALKIHSAATGGGFSATGPLEFLNTWTYKLGAEILTPFGREQL